MKNVEVEKIIKDILINELNLPQDYGNDDNGYIIPSVYIYTPEVSLGTIDKLQIGIQSIYSKVVANDTFTKNINDKMVEIKECVINDTIQIDIMSRNNEARTRRFEVLTALNSTYCKQMQELYNIKIFQIPSAFNNLNQIEASARIFRYNLTFNVIHKKQYTKEIDYYNQFSFNSWVNNNKNAESFDIPPKKV